MIYSNSVCCLGYVLDDSEIRAQFLIAAEQSLQTGPEGPIQPPIQCVLGVDSFRVRWAKAQS